MGVIAGIPRGGAPSLADQDYVGLFEQPTVPTTIQVPNGKWGWWRDTSVGTLYLVFNFGGTVHGVETTAF